MIPSLPLPCAAKPCEGNPMKRKRAIDLTKGLLWRRVRWQQNPMWWTSKSRTLPRIWLVSWFPTIMRFLDWHLWYWHINHDEYIPLNIWNSISRGRMAIDASITCFLLYANMIMSWVYLEQYWYAMYVGNYMGFMVVACKLSIIFGFLLKGESCLWFGFAFHIASKWTIWLIWFPSAIENGGLNLVLEIVGFP